MAEDFSLYEFARSLSLVGWIVLTLVLVATIYVISEGIEILVTKPCPFCAKRVPKRTTACPFCKKEGI